MTVSATVSFAVSMSGYPCKGVPSVMNAGNAGWVALISGASITSVLTFLTGTGNSVVASVSVSPVTFLSSINIHMGTVLADDEA